MKFFITVKPNSKEDIVDKLDDKHLLVRVKARAVDGKANVAAIKTLARYFGVAPSQVEIVSGHAARKKVAVIN